jgi:archaeosine synthase beta-subunit
MSDVPATKFLRVDDAWVAALRGPKPALDPARAYATLWEEEPDASGQPAATAAIFLTNRECPFRCVMCDLWVNTLDRTGPAGAIAAQIRHAIAQLPPARQVKLYNAGSFFDPQAISPGEDAQIAALLDSYDRVIVEAHPAFLAGVYGERCLRFRDRLRGRLEVAIGLETAHPGVLARLNKRMTLAGFEQAARFLGDHDIDLRVFILLNPPFLAANEVVEWGQRSIDVARDAGATACSVIPVRGGNGALEAIGADFVAARLPALEAIVAYGLGRTAFAPAPCQGNRRMRIFADLWDVDRFFECECSPSRAGRLRQMNRTQAAVEPVTCRRCDAGM